MKYAHVFALFLITFLLRGCSEIPVNDISTINYHLYPAPENTKIYLYKLPFHNEKLLVVDSGVIDQSTDTYTFKILTEKDRLYYIQDNQFRKKFYLIPDSSLINIYINILNNTSKVNGSLATISYNDFEESQKQIKNVINKDVYQVKKLNKNDQRLLADSLNIKIQANTLLLQTRYFNYADTVKNPAAFLAVYNNIDFGNNFTGLKSFINKASNRFANFKSVQNLKQETLKFISIYEEEFNVGDRLPYFQLPDSCNNAFSTASLQGKFYLVSFWAPWYPKTFPFVNTLKDSSNFNFLRKIKIVNVALDNDKENWKQVVKSKKIFGINLIDVNMWQGVATSLKFDSIPFNFLVSPQGIIINKAIKPDSLIYILQQSVK